MTLLRSGFLHLRTLSSFILSLGSFSISDGADVKKPKVTLRTPNVASQDVEAVTRSGGQNNQD